MTLPHSDEQPTGRDSVHTSAHSAAPAWQPVTLGGDVPPPKGAYSPGVRAGDLLFVSGQVPRDPRTGALVGEGDVAAQTRQTLANLAGVLAAGGASLRDVVSVTVHLANVDDWAAFDAVYRDVMPPPWPTRTVVGAELRGILVEVTAVAYLGAGR